MDPNHSPCWDSIQETVTPHIPNIDFDSSSSESEETVTIYQRPAGLSLRPGDFDLFPMEDDELEELLKPGSVILDNGEPSGAGVEACESDGEQSQHQFVKPNVDNTKSDEGFPVLSLARLEQWDLDAVLQNLKKGGIPLKECVSVDSSKTHADGDKDRSQEDLMDRLVTFFNSQSSPSVSEPLKSPNHIRHNNVSNKLSAREEAELQSSQQECPTAYMDLRYLDPSIKPQRTSPTLSPESKSAARLHAHQETPPAKKANHQVHAVSGSSVTSASRRVTGKSMLLQKIREKNRNGNTYPNKYTDPPGKLSQPVESTYSHDKQSPHEQLEQRNPQMESPPTSQQSTIKEQKQRSDQQQQTLQHDHQQILKQLEIHRPLKSVNQKQPAAERTDVLYDVEASHLQSIRTLPAVIGSKSCTLLIVNLSSPGVVEAKDHGRTKHLLPAATNNDAMCIKVGPESLDDEGDVGAKVPFWVAGLQQLWTEEGLALHVVAVARHSYTPRKRDLDIHTPFHKHVRRFLSETSLSLIGRWQLKDTEDQKASPVRLPSSCLKSFISTASSKKVIDRTFGLSPGFYWQTVETQEHVSNWRGITEELQTEVSVVLGYKAFLQHPLLTHHTLQLVLQSGLDVCGLRLLYPPQGFPADSAGAGPAVTQRSDDTCQPVLALAVRGRRAHSALKDIISSLDFVISRETGHDPLRSPLFHSSRPASRVHRELCLWFSGRIQGGSAQTDNRNSSSSSLLCATTKADILLVASPAVAPRCYGKVLAVCESRGFGLRGLHRLQLHSHGAAALGLSNQQARVFCSPHTLTLDQGQLELPSHCLVLLLRKENALHHSGSLPAAIMRGFEAHELLGCILSQLGGVHTEEPGLCFHTVPYSSDLFHIFVECMWTVPDPSSVILSHWKCSSDSDMEQVVILSLCGKDMSQGMSLLHRLLTEEPEGKPAGFKLLGLKWLPTLSRLQAQELSPYEVGQMLCEASLDHLRSSPALVCALRRVDAFTSLKRLLQPGYPGDLSVLMSSTPEVAFRQASLFFFEHEMISDHSIWPVLKFPPPNCSTEDPQMQLTVCLFKPTVWRHALAKTVCALQLSGLSLVGLHVTTLDRSSATSLLQPAESDPSDLEAHVEYLCSGSSLVLCLQGENAVSRLLDVLDQEDSSIWTYYGSGSYQKAIGDVRRLFPEGLCCSETSTMRREEILCMLSDPSASVEREQNCMLVPVNQESVSPSMTSGTKGAGRHSALWQTTCLLIPLYAPPLNQVASQLDMLEQLIMSDCHLVAGRMSILDDEQREHITGTLDVSSRGKERMAHLYTAPCLIVALQGRSMWTGFDLILKSIYKERSDLEQVGEMIVYPESQKEAEQLIRYLFDGLSPENCQSIVNP